MKRFCVVALLVVLTAMLLAVRASANSPPEAEFGVNILTPVSFIILLLYLAGCILIGLAKTSISEWCVAWLFRFDREERKLVLLTNLVSQGAMWVLFILIFLVGGIPSANFFYEYYIGWLIVLEALVYIFEYLWYRKKFVYYSWMRCLAFSVIANSASLALGLVQLTELF